MKKQINTFGLILLTITLFSFISDTSERPQPNLNGILGDSISLSKIDSLDQLVLQVDQNDMNVISYRIVIAPKNGEAFMATRKGNAVSEYVKSRISKCEAGNTRLLFDKVRAQNTAGVKTFCKPLMYKLVE